MSEKKMTAPPPCYAVLYPPLVEIARRHGYALAVHGSMSRDFDLVAVPWVADAGEPLPMIDEMKAAVQGVYTHHDFDHILKDGHRTSKPHGRSAWSIHLTTKGADGPYLDISVMPRVQAMPEPAILWRHEDVCGDEVGPPTPYYSETQMRAALGLPSSV